MSLYLLYMDMTGGCFSHPTSRRGPLDHLGKVTLYMHKCAVCLDSVYLNERMC